MNLLSAAACIMLLALSHKAATAAVSGQQQHARKLLQQPSNLQQGPASNIGQGSSPQNAQNAANRAAGEPPGAAEFPDAQQQSDSAGDAPAAADTTGAAPPPSCSNSKSPTAQVSGSQWRADLSGDNNIQPGTTGVPAPLNAPGSGTYLLTVDEQGQRASWNLELCDIQAYVASHLHTGSANADYPPPLIPLEPFVKPPNPLGPPEQLPQLCPPTKIEGCRQTQGSFTAADIVALPGRPNDPEVPAVNKWEDFLSALKAGNIYANIHSVSYPAGVIRGNLMPAGDSSQLGPDTQQGSVVNNGAGEDNSGSNNSGAGSSNENDNSGGDGSEIGQEGSSSGGPTLPAGFPGGIRDGGAPNFAAAFASSSSGPSGTRTEQGTYTRGNANADANANADRG